MSQRLLGGWAKRRQALPRFKLGSAAGHRGAHWGLDLYQNLGPRELIYFCAGRQSRCGTGLSWPWEIKSGCEGSYWKIHNEIRLSPSSRTVPNSSMGITIARLPWVAHCAANLLEATLQCRGRTSVVGRCGRAILSSSCCPREPTSAVQALNCCRVGGASAERERPGAAVAWNPATAEGAAPTLGCRSAGSRASRRKENAARGHGRPASGHRRGRHTGVRLPSASATSP
jgi:hypothetical protein